MERRLLVPGVVLAIVIALALPALAITNGTPDVEGNYPAVGQLLFFDPDFPDPRFDDPGGWFLCSGTLLSATVLLTAGHCTFGVGENGKSTLPDGRDGTDMWVNFAFAPDFSILTPSADFAPDDNQGRYEDWSSALDADPNWNRGRAIPHPNFDNAAFFLFDAGVVELDKSIPKKVHENDFGQLPTEGYLDQFLTSRGSEQRFTPVGYGLQTGFPTFQGDDTRYFAEVMLIDAKGVFGIPEGIAVVFSNNPGEHATGGTCFGDSGGPVFDGDTRTIVAVTSFGVNLQCVGTGGGYRIDQPDDLAFIGGHLDGNG